MLAYSITSLAAFIALATPVVSSITDVREGKANALTVRYP